MSAITCPKCGSDRVRASRKQNRIEQLRERLGALVIRCRDCDHRFTSGVIDVRNLLYAKCPRCDRLDLSSWKPEQYYVSLLRRMLLRMGGRPTRCNACRCNFVSFRLVKVQYTRQRRNASPVAVPDEV